MDVVLSSQGAGGVGRGGDGPDKELGFSRTIASVPSSCPGPVTLPGLMLLTLSLKTAFPDLNVL